MRLSRQQKKILSVLAVALSVFVIVILVQMTGWLQVAELKVLDHVIGGHADPTKAHPGIVLIAIDESSLEAFGRWPWPRDRRGYVVRYLKEAGAKAVIFDLMFFESDENAEEFDDSFAPDVKEAADVYLPVLLRNETAHQGQKLPASLARLRINGRRHIEDKALNSYQSVKLPISGLAQSARGLGASTSQPIRTGRPGAFPCWRKPGR
jgi:adenylate cyclase